MPFEIRKHPEFGSPLYSDDHCVLHRICKKGISQLFANLRRAFYEASQQREPKFWIFKITQIMYKQIWCKCFINQLLSTTGFHKLRSNGYTYNVFFEGWPQSELFYIFNFNHMTIIFLSLYERQQGVTFITTCGS